MKAPLISAAMLLALAGCTPPQPIGTPGGSSFYECSQGTRLRVDYRGRGAIARVNGRTTVALRSTPSTRGPVFEGRQGERLERRGDMVIWNTAARTAPEQCRPVRVPR